MRTRHYTTLRGLLQRIGYNRLALNELNSGRAFFTGSGWQAFTLSPEAREQAYNMIARVVWATESARQRNSWKLHGCRACGILERLYIRRGRGSRSGEVFAEYCAGQDYTAEIRYIQRSVLR